MEKYKLNLAPKANSASVVGLDLLLRRGEQGQVLPRVRREETCRCSSVQVRQMRLGA